EPPVAARLRHRLARPEGTGRVSQAPRRGREARSSPAGQGNGPVPPAGGSGRHGVLAPARLDALPHAGTLHAPAAGTCALSGSEDTAAGGPQALGSFG